MGILRLAAAGLVALVLGIWAGAGHATSSSGDDWTRFGWSPSRSSAPTFSTGIKSDDISKLRRQQVQLGGTADSSPIYLHGVTVEGASHDVFFVTTTYGKTVAVDASSGA